MLDNLPLIVIDPSTVSGLLTIIAAITTAVVTIINAIASSRDRRTRRR